MTPSDRARRRDEEEEDSREGVVGFIPGCNEQAGCQCRSPPIFLAARPFRRWLTWGMEPQPAVSRHQGQPAQAANRHGGPILRPLGQGHNPRFLLRNHKAIIRL